MHASGIVNVKYIYEQMFWMVLKNWRFVTAPHVYSNKNPLYHSLLTPVIDAI